MVVPAGVVLRRPAQQPDVDVAVPVQADVVPLLVAERDVRFQRSGVAGHRAGQASGGRAHPAAGWPVVEQQPGGRQMKRLGLALGSLGLGLLSGCASLPDLQLAKQAKITA